MLCQALLAQRPALHRDTVPRFNAQRCSYLLGPLHCFSVRACSAEWLAYIQLRAKHRRLGAMQKPSIPYWTPFTIFRQSLLCRKAHMHLRAKHRRPAAMHKPSIPYWLAVTIFSQSAFAVQEGSHSSVSQAQEARRHAQSRLSIPNHYHRIFLNNSLPYCYSSVSQPVPAVQEGAHTFASQAQQSRSSAQSRLFPFMLHQRCPALFSYSSSSFVVQRSKAGTARVVCWQDLGIANRCSPLPC